MKQIVSSYSFKELLSFLKKHGLEDEVMVDTNVVYVLDNKSVRVLLSYDPDLRIV